MPCKRHTALVCLAVALIASKNLPAQERHFRLFDAAEGLNPVAVRALAQDSVGFLWIGTQGGLVRYDGVEMRRWSPELIDRMVVAITASTRGSVVALREGGALFEVTADDTRPVPGPRGAPITRARNAAFDSEGSLWVILDDEVWKRGRQHRWTRIPVPLGIGERPTLLRPGYRGTVLLATTEGAWRLAPGSTERLLELRDIVDLYSSGDGRVFVLGFLGDLHILSDDGWREVLHASGLVLGRAISIVQRGSTIWIAIDRYLVGWRPDGPIEVLGVESGIQSGGPLLVDHEGSLWMGSYLGLYQFPEPETRIWTERAGLPSNHARYLARTEDTVWVTTWQGAGYVRDDPGDRIAGRAPWSSHTRMLVDSRGILWAGTDHGIVEIEGGRVVRHHGSGPIGLYGYHETETGEIWLATSDGLLHRASGTHGLEPIATPVDEEETVDQVLLDRSGTLWISSGERVCHARPDPSNPDQWGGWRCERIEGAVHLTGLVQTAGEGPWASTNRLGILRWHSGSWSLLPGLRSLPSRSILSLVPARSGGIWIVGHGVLHRVRDASDEPSGWRVEERLSIWQGLPATSGTFLLEDPDGGVWVTTSRGVAHVPSEARYAWPQPPRVVLVDARVDDRQIPIGSELELPHEQNRLELRFAALSFRDPALVRYQVRLSESEPWVTTSGQASFRWVDLSPGRYRAEVRASLDGVMWSPVSAAFSFRVTPPWYRQPWAIALYAALGLLFLYAVHRLRVAHLIRLERQQTRIAMDLHDNIGSGLGSIGILSGILANDGVGQTDRSEMARQIAGTARELGSSLSHIVWALDPKARSLEELAARLAEHGRRLFPSDTVTFMTRFPDAWPSAPVAPLVRQNVLLIGLEALHNAARHAGAQNVELAFEPVPDGAWNLTVGDDGGGMAPDSKGGGGAGMGLRSMRRRAEEMGAEIRWSSSREGTRMTLVFQPGRTRWWSQHVRARSVP